jgi:para-aminobenzoate synthetase component 1
MNTLVEDMGFYLPLSEIFAHYAQAERAVFLDSSLRNHLGRYSIVGLNPYLTLEDKGGVCFQNGEEQSSSFMPTLKRCLAKLREQNKTGLPLTSGAIGYLSYDFGRSAGRVKTRHTPRLALPNASLSFYDNLLIEDHEARRVYLTSRGVTQNARQSIDSLREQIRSAAPTTLAPSTPLAPSASSASPAPTTPTPTASASSPPSRSSPQTKLDKRVQTDFSPDEYKEAVARMIRYMLDGDIYVANMTQQLRIPSEKSPYETFLSLRRHNPSPFGAYINCENAQIVCASPERFLRVQNGHVETRPIKGTRKRGATPREDRMMRDALSSSEKDRSELLMIVDLLRNDLSRVCRTGSVKVTEHFAIEAYATVFHLVTSIVGQLEHGRDVCDLIEAAFPGGSITGAPKTRAMEIIDELERAARQLYTGSIGYIGLDGSCDLNITIRTAVYQDGCYHVGVGGGITCESELDFEYEETLQKAKAILAAIFA